MEVRFDLHIHSERSPDGRMSLDEIVSCARARGLQGVAVCDHDRALTETWDAPDFLLIPGIELSTDQGHLLGLFVTEQIEARELDAAIDAVHADTPNRWPLCTFVPGPRDSYNSPDDRHYSAAGQRELGRRMWQQYREMCAEQLADYGAR